MKKKETRPLKTGKKMKTFYRLLQLLIEGCDHLKFFMIEVTSFLILFAMVDIIV